MEGGTRPKRGSWDTGHPGGGRNFIEWRDTDDGAVQAL